MQEEKKNMNEKKERFPIKYIFIFSIRGLVGTCDRNAVLR